MPLAQSSYTRDFGKPISEEADTSYPRFYTEAEQTMIDGVPGWREVEMVEIIMPGNNMLTKPVHYVNDDHRARWPKSYAAFKANEELALTGTPLEQWPVLKKSQVMTLKSLGFRTVEDIAAMTEIAIQKVGMGGRELKKMAIIYVDDAQKDAVANKAIQDAAKWEARSQEQDAQIRSLNEQLQTQGEQLRQIMTNQQLAQQNVASTPLVIVPTAAHAQPATLASPFANFASRNIESRSQERRVELSAFNATSETEGVQAEQPRPAEVSIQVPAKRRGRPPRVAAA